VLHRPVGTEKHMTMSLHTGHFLYWCIHYAGFYLFGGKIQKVLVAVGPAGIAHSPLPQIFFNFEPSESF